MTGLYTTITLLIFNAIVNTAGTIALKVAASSLSPALAVIGIGLYAAGAAAFIALLQLNQPLAVLAVVTSALGLLSVISIDVIWFSTGLSRNQWIGIGLTVLGIMLVSLPDSTG